MFSPNDFSAVQGRHTLGKMFRFHYGQHYGETHGIVMNISVSEEAKGRQKENE